MYVQEAMRKKKRKKMRGEIVGGRGREVEKRGENKGDKKKDIYCDKRETSDIRHHHHHHH